MDGYQYNPPESALVHQSSSSPHYTTIRWGEFIAGDGIPIIRWPEPEKKWQMPKSGHIDAYGGKWPPFMIGATTYLYDVETKGGSFIFWPDSHYPTHRYFRQNPAHVDGSFMRQEGFAWDVFCDNLRLEVESS